MKPFTRISQPNPSLKPQVSSHSRGQLLPLLLLMTLSTVTLSSCGSIGNTPATQTLHQSGMAPPAPAAIPAADIPASKTVAEMPKNKPQLIKRADLSLVVKSIENSVKTVAELVKTQQGDILGFQDNKPQDPNVRHTVSMQLRVPQKNLETTLNTLIKLGTIQSQGLTAEDVSDQLVDIDARLRNLRKSEEMVLKIMERSGSVGEVLKASQELSKIRESIERMEAQLKNLQNQVAYSTISLTLQAPLEAATADQPSLAIQLQETWGKATHSVQELTFNLIGTTVWLLAYSPYLLLLGLGIYGYKRQKKQRRLSAQSPNSVNSELHD